MLAKAEADGLSFTDFALALLRAEITARRERSLTRGLRRSHLGTVEGLDGFDFAKRPQLESRVVRELLNCRFVEEHRNVLCLGKPGLGKTRIAKAIAHAACTAGYSCLCVLTAEMLEDLHASQADRSFSSALRCRRAPSCRTARGRPAGPSSEGREGRRGCLFWLHRDTTPAPSLTRGRPTTLPRTDRQTGNRDHRR